MAGICIVPSKMSAGGFGISDHAEIASLHRAMNMPYAFPDLSSELFTVKCAVRDGEIVAAGVVKIIGEVYLWLDSSRSLRDKLKAVGMLDAEMEQRTKLAGFDQVVAWLPPTVPPSFKRLMGNTGWQESKWASWGRNL